MARKFLEGLVFGGGFALSLLVLLYLATFFGIPIPHSISILPGERSRAAVVPATRGATIPSNFYELSIEDQIKQASAIVLVRYEPSAGNKVKAVVSDILKKNQGVELRYKVGDEYPPATYYGKDGSDRGEGQVVFFVGSPAEMKMSASYSGDRIQGLGDIPLRLFREKCGRDNT